jgi:hypothetical protein
MSLTKNVVGIPAHFFLDDNDPDLLAYQDADRRYVASGGTDHTAWEDGRAAVERIRRAGKFFAEGQLGVQQS